MVKNSARGKLCMLAMQFCQLVRQKHQVRGMPKRFPGCPVPGYTCNPGFVAMLSNAERPATKWVGFKREEVQHFHNSQQLEVVVRKRCPAEPKTLISSRSHGTDLFLSLSDFLFCSARVSCSRSRHGPTMVAALLLLWSRMPGLPTLVPGTQLPALTGRNS
eukprot:963194-Rhodomonas_salina.1